MKEFFDTVFSQMDKSNQAFRESVELQKGILKRYQDQIAREMSNDPLNEMMSDFSKAIMLATMEVAAHHRESRKRFLEMQASIAEAYLNLLEKMEKDPAAASGSTTQQTDSAPHE